MAGGNSPDPRKGEAPTQARLERGPLPAPPAPCGRGHWAAPRLTPDPPRAAGQTPVLSGEGSLRVGTQKRPEPAQRDRKVTGEKERAPRTAATLRPAGPFRDREAAGGRWAASLARKHLPGGLTLRLLHRAQRANSPAWQQEWLRIISPTSRTPGPPPSKNMGTWDPYKSPGPLILETEGQPNAQL